ncbi:MAG TPA: methyl-accepting chemotaxis protein [Thermodesulfovibrionales bacterium]|nr:methyl-accepting chemotaxis protein [Thermodesulfovibrionales bacterium]
MLTLRARSIKTKISILILGLLIIVFGLSWGYSYWNLYKKAGEDLKAEAQTIARLIGGIASYTFLTEDYTMLDEILQKAMENEEVLSIKILDKDGNPKRESRKDRPDKRSIQTTEPIMVAEAPAGSVELRVSAEKNYTGLMRDVRTTLVIVLLGLALSSAFLIFLLNRLIVGPISLLDRRAKEIAVGDLTYTIDVRGEDEIASLGKSINAMALSLKDIIFKIRSITDTISIVTSEIAVFSGRVLSGATDQKGAVGETARAMEEMNASISGVAANTESLTELSEETASSIMQMDSAIAQVAESASVFNEYTAQTASSIEEMIASIAQIAENLRNLSTSSEETSVAISEMSASVGEVGQSATESVKLAEEVDRHASDRGMTALNAAMQGMYDIRENVGALSESINRLGKKSVDIGAVLTVINDVTDQTVLLALNAAILAAQAGEHGKAFSVVADEIKNLAERTTTSTKEIERLILSVQEETQSSVAMTAKGIGTVERGVLLVQDVAGALKDIIASSRRATEMSKAIQRTTGEEVGAINQITNAVRIMSDEIAQITRATGEQSKGSSFIIKAAEKMKDESGQIKNATREQTHESKLITNAIEKVTQQTAEVATSTKTQRAKSTEIVAAIDRIHVTTDELIESSAKMDRAINALKDGAGNLLTEVQKFKV